MSDGSGDQILVEPVGKIAKVRLNRPDKLNALTAEMLVELKETIARLGRAGKTDGIILCGAGRAFSAGEDLSQVHDPEEPVGAAVQRFHEITLAILGTEVPIAAAIEGIAVGGAAEITLCCDTRIGSGAAELFLPENSRGLIVSNAASYILPRLVGGARALSIVLGAKRLDAAEAERIGLLDSVVAAGRAERVAEETLRSWGSGATTREHLRLLRPSVEEVERAMRRESESALAAWNAGATSAGIASFLDRERPASDS